MRVKKLRWLFAEEALLDKSRYYRHIRRIFHDIAYREDESSAAHSGEVPAHRVVILSSIFPLGSASLHLQ